MTKRAALRLSFACALLSGCLVTHELDFNPSRSPATAIKVSPAGIARASTDGDSECKQQFPSEEAMLFQARFYDEDVEQTVWVVTVINGVPQLRALEAKSTDGTALHTLPQPLCIPNSLLGLACNHVELLVSDVYANAINLERDNPNVQVIEWWVLPKAGDSPNMSGAAGVQVSDCAPGDGGV